MEKRATIFSLRKIFNLLSYMFRKIAFALLFILFVTPATASALSLSEIFSGVQGIIANLVSGTSQTAATALTQSSLTVRTDKGQKGPQMMVLGEAGFAGHFVFSATGAAYTVQELRIKIPSDAATSVESVQLSYVTQSQTGNSATQAVVLPTSVESHGVATFTGLNMYVPKDAMGILTVFLNTPTDKMRVKPGVVLSAALDTSTGFKAVDAQGKVVTSVGSGDLSSEIRLYPINTYPVITHVPVAVRNTPTLKGIPLIKFRMGTHVRGDIEWHKLSFDVHTTGVSIGDFTLYDVTSSAVPVNTTPVNGQGSNTISICPGSSCDGPGTLGVPAGGERVYELRAATVDGWGDVGDSVVVRYLSDESPASPSGMLEQKGNVVWSDRSASSHPVTSRDWFNGFFVPGLAGSSFFVISDPSRESKLKLTAPNGGEKWDVGSMNTITWSPYGYDPDINPPREVSAWLETKNGNNYKTVGKIVPSGKASIHWEGQIETGTPGVYTRVKPGQYYVRIDNTVTGESDRSDKPFSMILSTDLRINNSDGPVKVDTSKPVKLAWKSVGTQSCEIHNAYKDLSRTEQIGSVKTTWFIQAYLHPSWGPTIVCQKADGTTVSDYVPIEVKQGPANVKITKPNGGEKINPASGLDITFQYANVNSYSLALYKNDKWVYWIAKDHLLDASSNVQTVAWSGIQEMLASLGEATTTGAVYKFYVTASKLDGSGYVDDKSDKPFSFTAPAALKTPVISKFSASPAKIMLGKSSTLSWSVKDASRCVLLSPEGEEAVRLTGSKKVTPSAGEASYTLWCSNEPGDGKDGPSASKAVSIIVDTPALKTPTITRFTATPGSVKGNQPTVLSWATKDATTCVLASPLGKDLVEVNGKLSVSVTEHTTFTLYCSNVSTDGRASPEVSKQVSVKFTAALAPSCTITSDKKLYRLNDTAKITWTSQNATSALWVPDTSGKDVIAPPNAVPTPKGSASVKVTVGGAPTLTLMVKGNGGEATCRVVLQGVPVFPNESTATSTPEFYETSTASPDTANAFSALQMALQATLSIMR